MAIAMLVEVPGMNQEQYEVTAAEINKDGLRVGGAFLHAAGPMENGCWIIEIWESQEKADAFYSSPRMLEVAARLTQRPKTTSWPLYALDGSGLKQLGLPT